MQRRRESRRDRLVRRMALLRVVLKHPQNRSHGLRALGRMIGWQLWRRLIGKPVTYRFWESLRVRVYPDWPYSWTAIYLGLPEYDEMLFALRYLRPGDAIVDVGANIGFYSLLGSSVNGGAPVLAFEPHPLASARLRENAALNAFSNIQIRPMAVGDRSTTARLTRELADENRIEVNALSGEPTVPVRVVTMDSELSRLQIDPAQVRLVKVDTEGFEARVLGGAGLLLTQDPGPVWLVELTGLGDRYGCGDEAVCEIFREHGMRAFRYSAEEDRLSPCDPLEGPHGNVIFMRPSLLTAVRARLRASSRRPPIARGDAA